MTKDQYGQNVLTETSSKSTHRVDDNNISLYGIPGSILL